MRTKDWFEEIMEEVNVVYTEEIVLQEEEESEDKIFEDISTVESEAAYHHLGRWS